MAVYLRIKNPTPARGELCRRVVRLSSAGVCTCAPSWRLSICQWNITTANKLWDCFALSECPGWINLRWEINKSAVVLSQALFSPLSDSPRSSWAFFINWLHSVPTKQRNHSGGGHLSLHQRRHARIFYLFFFLQLQLLMNPSGAISALSHPPQMQALHRTGPFPVCWWRNGFI